jgi:hypothetical protein
MPIYVGTSTITNEPVNQLCYSRAELTRLFGLKFAGREKKKPPQEMTYAVNYASTKVVQATGGIFWVFIPGKGAPKLVRKTHIHLIKEFFDAGRAYGLTPALEQILIELGLPPTAEEKLAHPVSPAHVLGYDPLAPMGEGDFEVDDGDE